MNRRRATAAGAISIIISIVVIAAAACGDDEADDRSAGTIEVAYVEAVGCDRPQTRSGVGAFVADDVVLTAAHVVEGDLRELRVGETPAVVVGIDARTDLALVALIEGDSTIDRDRPHWSVTPPSDAYPGAVQVLTPNGSVDVTLIRTLTLRVDDISDDTVSERAALELDVVVEPGASGSPVIDAGGDLVGIVTLRRPSTGVTYASTIPPFAELLDHAIYQEVRADPLARPEPCT